MGFFFADLSRNDETFLGYVSHEIGHLTRKKMLFNFQCDPFVTESPKSML